ncbi:lipid IV(A) 3-deoxy-D-manno-octulosonic acid transferase [Vibrio ishigakensis]|uniref:lipid IV(A) 3-deoxy-D-manno-octulosonic acid transferase n=1 Tax=Vibrio ishigakensis TaxID=1481914 RepID=UPI0021C3EBE9|nr:lipid IV(A) 3-deoxy-D-manno-octulosonic acid transferase [Vibrio ishigakensis]
MIKIFYTIVLAILSPLLLYKLLKRKHGKPNVGNRWTEYFGITSPIEGINPIWFHTVSVGEIIAATPLIRAVKARYPHQNILITTTTATGAEQAQKLKDLAEHKYMPIDFSWCVKGFLKATKPSCMLIMETELWPNTLHTVAKSGIPITVINARLSERSCLRYQKVQAVFSTISQNIDLFLCQHKDDAGRFNRLGVDKTKTTVTGSLKFDIAVPAETIVAGQTLRAQLGEARPVWIATSTHAGEDEQLLQSHQKLLSHQPQALLILVPRHPERFNDVIELSKGMQLKTIARTSKRTVTSDTQVYVADTMGEMLLLIESADICFMAGSLVGDKVGGHNLLEPAALGKPMLNGPSYFNFTDIANQLLDKQSVMICADSDEIANQLQLLFKNKNLREKMGANALEVVRENQGALEKTLTAIAPYIK